MVSIEKRIVALEQLHAGEQLSDEERAQRIKAILNATPADPRAPRILELLAIARDRRDRGLPCAT